MMTRDDCAALEAKDSLRDYRRKFVLPQNLIYLDGNSLGPMPHGVQVLRRVLDEKLWDRPEFQTRKSVT